MHKHTYIALETLKVDGQYIYPGDGERSRVEMTEASARELLALGVIEPAQPGVKQAGADPAGDADVAETVAASAADEIVAAIGQLDPDDPDHFTRSGVPQVSALEALLGRDITSAERDAAWAVYQAHSGKQPNETDD